MTQSNPINEADAAPAVRPTTSSALDTYLHERLANVKKALPPAAIELKAAGVVLVHVHYDGCGDSGQIESIEYLYQDRASAEPPEKMTLRPDQLMDLFYDVLEIRHAGWENGEGACGDFEWDLKRDVFRHIHRERFTDYDTTKMEGL